MGVWGGGVTTVVGLTSVAFVASVAFMQVGRSEFPARDTQLTKFNTRTHTHTHTCLLYTSDAADD